MSEAPARLVEALADRYRIERELGAGGMATVWLAEDLKHHRKVAIKVLRPELASAVGAERFLAEIQIIANLQHPHILGLIDSGDADGLLYFVMPFVEGESLRARLTRETQLPIDEAVRIASEVGSALDYAHRHHVVHRDIKPENILLHDGNALVADFGIALAVQGSAGDRLTATGTSIGTPRYMSPEQATSGKNVDARSDIYSLGVLLYEMLAGEPPFTGPTGPSIVAKLLVERPTQLRVVRSAVPEAVNAAVARALEKVPADRFESAAELVHAIRAGVDLHAIQPQPGRRKLGIAAAGLVAASLIIGGVVRFASRPSPHSAILLDRIQVTSTGHASSPSISTDGKQLAYLSEQCGPKGCTYGIDLQDVGNPNSRRAVDLLEATNVTGVKWSPDRRNFLVWLTGRDGFGSYIVPALGGTPRRLPYLGADFYAGGDSLIMASVGGIDDSVHWVLIAAVDGQVRDSIRVAGVANGFDVWSVAGSSLIAVALSDGDYGGFTEWRVINRQGGEASHLAIKAQNGVFTRDAAWFRVDESGGEYPARLVRLPFTAATGRFGSRRDTVLSGWFAGFDVTPDGQRIVTGEYSVDSRLWVSSVADAIRGAYAETPPRIQSSAPLGGAISPDGSRLLVWRSVGTAQGPESRVSVLAVAGGVETPLATVAAGTDLGWVDSVTIRLVERDSSGLKLVLIDARTGAHRGGLVLSDSDVAGFDWLSDQGWAWLQVGGTALNVWHGHDPGPRRIRAPSALRWNNLAASPDGQQVALTGSIGVGGTDTLQLSVLSLSDTVTRPWVTLPAFLYGRVQWLPDGTLLLTAWDKRYWPTLYRVRGPGKVQRLGSVPRASGLNIADNLTVASIRIREWHSDIFLLSRVEFQ